jgi:hypothetical protein
MAVSTAITAISEIAAMMVIMAAVIIATAIITAAVIVTSVVPIIVVTGSVVAGTAHIDTDIRTARATSQQKGRGESEAQREAGR